MADNNQPTTTPSQGLTHPSTDHASDYTAYLADQLQSTSLDDIELRICADTTETHAKTDENGNYQFEYQPGSLWLTFNSEISLCVMATPNCERGIIAKPTSSLPSARPVSDHFYYCIYEALARTETEIAVPTDTIEVDDNTVHVSERYHLHEILREAFTTESELTGYTSIILEKAQEMNTRHKEEKELPLDVDGQVGGLEEFLPENTFEEATITEATPSEPLAPVDRLVAKLYDAAGEDIIMATPIVTTTVGMALKHAADQGSNVSITVDTRVLDALNTEMYETHDNISITVTDAPVPAPIITTTDTLFITSVDGQNKPTALIESCHGDAYDWARDYLSELEIETQPFDVATEAVGVH